MELYTKSFWKDWDRIVDIYPQRCTDLPDYINDDSTYKLLILEKGVLQIGCQCSDMSGDGYADAAKCRMREKEPRHEVKAPALVLLSQRSRIDWRITQPVKADLLFFKPSVIRDEFTFDRVDGGEFEQAFGRVIYQDYLLIRFFAMFETMSERIIPLPLNALKRIKELFTATEGELKQQRDGFWPCRSRSYLMELLYFILYSFIEALPAPDKDEETADAAEFSRITEYLNEHIDRQITLELLTKEFSINRNKLNDLFMKQASMTCLNYLLQLRMDLAKILLTKTELPIGEISTRVGYADANYFTKVFSKNTGMTPSKYRKS